MTDQQVLDEEAILRLVQAWSRDRQVHLARRILDPGLQTLDPQTGRPYVTSTESRGIGSGGHPTPSDDEIEQWHMEKYGA